MVRETAYIKGEEVVQDNRYASRSGEMGAAVVIRRAALAVALGLLVAGPLAAQPVIPDPQRIDNGSRPVGQAAPAGGTGTNQAQMVDSIFETLPPNFDQRTVMSAPNLHFVLFRTQGQHDAGLGRGWRRRLRALPGRGGRGEAVGRGAVLLAGRVARGRDQDRLSDPRPKARDPGQQRHDLRQRLQLHVFRAALSAPWSRAPASACTCSPTTVRTSSSTTSVTCRARSMSSTTASEDTAQALRGRGLGGAGAAEEIRRPTSANGTSSSRMASIAPSSTNRYSDIQQDSAKVASLVALYLVEMRLSLRFLVEFSDQTSKGIRWLTQERMRSFNVTTN
jgi:hypothetical protein